MDLSHRLEHLCQELWILFNMVVRVVAELGNANINSDYPRILGSAVIPVQYLTCCNCVPFVVFSTYRYLLDVNWLAMHYYLHPANLGQCQHLAVKSESCLVVREGIVVLIFSVLQLASSDLSCGCQLIAHHLQHLAVIVAKPW